MKKKSKWALIILAATMGSVLLVVLCAYSYFIIGFPPQEDGIERLNSITKVRLTDRVVFYGTTGGIEDWQEYFRFKATEDEVKRIVTSLRLEKAAHHIHRPGFYWWAPEEGNEETYSSDLGSSYYYLHYNATNNEAHLADVHL